MTKGSTEDTYLDGLRPHAGDTSLHARASQCDTHHAQAAARKSHCDTGHENEKTTGEVSALIGQPTNDPLRKKEGQALSKAL